MDIKEIEEMRSVMLGESDPSLTSVVDEVIEALDEIKASMEIETPVAEPVDKIKEALMENTEHHLGVIEEHDAANSRSMTNNLIRGFTERMIDMQAAKHFVGIQPMTGPVGVVYALEYNVVEENRMSLDIKSYAVEAGTRKLAMNLEFEAMEDIEAGHPNADKIDPGAEIAKEIYEEIRNDISHIARKDSLDMDKVIGDSLYFDQDIIIRMEMSINVCANEIARNTRRGAGNFIIVSETVGEILKHSKQFVSTSETDKDYGYVKYLGTLNGTIKIYCDFGLEYNKTIVGYKGGNGETDTGYIYAPYIPLMSSGVVINPTTFQPYIRFMTRYGKIVIQKTEETTTENGLKTTIAREPCNYYVELTFDNLPKLDTIDFKEDDKKEEHVADDMEDLFDEAMKLLN